MLRKQFVIGPVKVNCNVVYSTKTKGSLFIVMGGILMLRRVLGCRSRRV